MLQWVVLVGIAQFINAIVAIIDKYLVSSKRVREPVVYAFYISILSSLSIIVFLFSGIDIPFTDQFSIPSFSNIELLNIKATIAVIVASFSFLGALIALFSAFVKADASDVVPVVGSVAAISTLFLSLKLLGSSISGNFIWGFILLVFGTLIVSHLRFSRMTVLFSIIAGFLFGLNTVMLKLLFNETNFDSGFFWSRVGIVLVAILLLLTPYCCKVGKTKHSKTTSSSWFIILGNKVLAGIAGILVLKAIELGDASIVQALGGLQFLYLLLFALIFGKRTPYSCGENCTKKELLHKTIAVIIISVGFVFLFL